MKKYFILSLLSVALVGGSVFAQTEDVAVTAVNAETVTNADLGIPNPGLLPTNPFYFLKEFGRAVRRAVTFDSVKKAELELNITNEKVAELKQVEENQPQNTEAIQNAIQNYQDNQTRLIQKFENLTETSSNPNIEKLLQNFADKAVKHAKVFDELQNKFENQNQISGEINQVREMASNVVAAASAKDEPAKFAAKVERVLTTEKGSELKNVRSIEILDNFIKNASDEVKVSLEKVRDDVSSRLQTDIKNAIRTQGAETVKQAIMNLPGNAVRRAVILKELEQKAGGAVFGVLQSAVTTMNKEIISGENIMEKAQAQLQSAGDALSKLANRLNENVQPPANVKELYEKAKNAYEKGKAAFFEEKKYGEAFGQATSAEMAARNALRAFEEKTATQTSSLKSELDRMEMTLVKYADYFNSHSITAESNPKAYKLITGVKEFLSLARNAYAKNDSESVKNYIKQIRDYLNSLVQFIEGDVRTENKVPELKAVVPTLTKFIYKNSSFRSASWQCYDGKEFSNDKSSVCKSSEEWQAEAKKFCDGHCYADNSKCGVNSWGISNECGAENSGSGATVVPAPTTTSRGTVISACASAKLRPAYLDEMLKAGKIDEVKYKSEYENAKKEIEQCVKEENKVVVPLDPCSSFRQALDNLNKAHTEGSISEEVYNRKYESYKTDVLSCEQKNIPVPVPTISSGGGGSGSVSTGIANPASSYCVQKGYKNIIRTSSDGGQYGVCVFLNGKECEEWKFYRGECVVDAASVSDCGAKPVLPATPANCKYDGPHCVSGRWDYKMICADTTTTVTNTTSGASSGGSSGAVPAVKTTPVQADSSGMGY